jgi:hypothetical protein
LGGHAAAFLAGAAVRDGALLAGSPWPPVAMGAPGATYERASAQVLPGDNTDLHRHLRDGWEVERTSQERTGSAAVTTDVLRRRRLRGSVSWASPSLVWSRSSPGWWRPSPSPPRCRRLPAPAVAPRYERFALPARCARDPLVGRPRLPGCAWSLNELLRDGWEVERIEQADGLPFHYHVRRPQR